STILRTIDSGLNWTVQAVTGDPGRDLLAVATSGGTGIAVGLNAGGTSTVLRSTDSGVSWNLQAVTLDPGQQLNAVAFSTSANVVAVGAAGTILRSTDGGAAWGVVGAAVTGSELVDVAIDAGDASRALAVGMAGTIVRSTDSGATWAVVGTAVTGNNLNGVVYSGTTAIAVGDGGTIVRSADGGATWATETSATANNLNDIIYNGSTGLAVGDAGTIRRSVLTAPIFGVAPNPLAFGNVNVGTPSVLPITVTNTGTGPLTVTNVVSDHGNFVPDLTAFVVAAGANQVVNVTFTPTATGALSESLTFTHDAAGSPSVVTMTGTGTAPVFSVAPNPLAFGNVNVGTPSVLPITVTNTGTGPLTLSSIVSSHLDFVHDGTPIVLAAGANVVVNVTFTPSSPGGISGSLTFTHDAAGSPSAVSMTGTGIGPGIDVTPTSLSFGNVVILDSKALTLNVTNTGNTNLVVSSITSNDLQFVRDVTSFTVAPSAIQVVEVTFTPVIGGSMSGSLTISHNAGSDVVVAMTGDGTVRVSTPLDLVLDFGAVETDNFRTLPVELFNPSAVNLTITGIVSNDPSFVADLNTFVMPPLGTQIVNVTFAPRRRGNYEGLLSVTHNPTVTVSMIGGTPIGASEKSTDNPLVIVVAFGGEWLLAVLVGAYGLYRLRRDHMIDSLTEGVDPPHEDPPPHGAIT
ncbi:MAG: choice-of-anchor D domain-containing protein, partial [Gemmatimonadetes bacterium]|nr:choice-of-anchor D domain-containing protein [Gemmatimonadota bacterium]